jgi:hypothetical protein
MWSRFSRLKASEVTTVIENPRAAHAKASEVPVLPPVYSTTVTGICGAVDDRQRHPVLHASGRVLALDLHEHAGVAARHDPLQFHEGRITDGPEDVRIVSHTSHLCFETLDIYRMPRST